MPDIFYLLLIGCIHFIALCFAGRALLTKNDPRSALGWTVALVFLPVIGLVIYLIFGIGRAHSHAEVIMRRIAGIEEKVGVPPEKDAESPASPEAMLIANMAHELTGAPLYSGNLITPLHNGDEAYPAMIEAINKADNHVYLGTYIFNYGHAAKMFIDALVGAHKRGVDVRVLVDGIGALYSWQKPWQILAGKGIKTARFRPPSLFPPNFGINLRSHRKVLICDETGFTGGMNIADGDLLKLNPNGKHHIQDVQFHCEGPIVTQLRQAFLLNWGFCTGEITPLPPLTEKQAGQSLCRVVVDGPGNDADPMLDLICGVINIARKKVRIMTPYFLPPPGLTAALRSAAQRGVDTRVILPAKNNLGYINWAMERIIPALLASGVRFWYQKPPFAHTKLLAVDDFYSLVGSANMDSRSLLLNFEMDMEIYDPVFHDTIANIMDKAMAHGEEIKKEYFKNMSLAKRLRNSACWIFSPYF